MSNQFSRGSTLKWLIGLCNSFVGVSSSSTGYKDDCFALAPNEVAVWSDVWLDS